MGACKEPVVAPADAELTGPREAADHIGPGGTAGPGAAREATVTEGAVVTTGADAAMLPLMFTIAVANHKGGVGKTYSALRLATEFAQRGQRALLIDADAQAHATLYLLGMDAPVGERGDLSYILDGRRIAEIVVHLKEGFDLLPSSLRVAEMDMRLAVDSGRRDQRLLRALQLVESDYDFVVIDCPPALSLVTMNSLAAADVIVAPVNLTNFALHGLRQFLDWLEQFRQEGIVRAQLLAVLPTFYDGRQRADRDGLIELHNSGLPLMDPIPRRTGIEGLVASRVAGQPLRDSSEPAVAAAYAAAADRLMRARAEALAEVAR